MKIPRDEFKRLQQQWYQKLVEHGFRDIEKSIGEELVLIHDAAYCYREVDAFERQMKEEYFRCMGQIVNDEDTEYRNDIDRYILIRHAEGAKVKSITKELEAKGTPRHRHSVRFIIRSYEMSWGIRKYTDKQLNMRKMK